MNTRIFRQGSKDAAFHIARTEQKPEAVAQQRIVYAMAQLQDGNTSESDILYYSGCIAEAIKHLDKIVTNNN